MDAKLLEPEELRVECELRNIKGLMSVQQSLLQYVLDQELQGEEDKPERAHEAALKNPRREVTLCAKQIVTIKENLLEILKSDVGHKSLALETMLTRAHHYHSRLDRISSSPSVTTECPSVLKLCLELIKVLSESGVNEEEQLNASITHLTELDTNEAKILLENKTLDNIATGGSGSTDKNPLNRLGTDSETNPQNSPPVDARPAVSSNLNLPTGTLSGLPPNVELGSKVNILGYDYRQPPPFSSLIAPVDLAHCSKFPPPGLTNTGNYPKLPTTSNNCGQNEVIVAPEMQIPSNIQQNISPNVNTIVLQQIQSLLNRLEIQSNPLQNINMNSNNQPHSNSQNPNSIPVASSPHLQNSIIGNDFQNRPHPISSGNTKASIVHKWNIVYDGTKDGMNVERFLYRVESNASSYNISHWQLLSDIQYLLKGKALNWYWAHREAVRPTSWTDFRNAMLRQFKDEYNDFDIRKKITERKQKPSENFQDFYAAISELTLSLATPLSDFEFMLILHGNMREGLLEKLAGKRFHTSVELFNECVHIENDWRQMGFVPEKLLAISRSFQTPRTPQNSLQSSTQAASKPYRAVHEIEYDCVYPENSFLPQTQNPGQSAIENLSQSQTGEVCALAPNQPFATKLNSNMIPSSLYAKVRCWNCGKLGHFYYRCAMELQHIFCRGCGQADILFEYCSKCQENCRRGVRTGRQASQNNQSNPQQKPQVEEAACNTDPEFYRILHRNS